MQRLQEAISFAARAHAGQVRKDGRTPYIAHPFRVLMTARHVFGMTDEDALIVAVLHDTVEDTTTDFDDLHERFGPVVAGAVAALTKDKRLIESEREAAYFAALRAGDDIVKLCKLADVYDNLLDSAHLSASARAKTIRRSGEYLDVFKDDDSEVVRKALMIVVALWNELSDL